ncbi:MAG: GIY-YIG nuclease family protein [Chloroflexi bacterium]|nr:GIY-YIG nuclease family protein [Chloroflexota bacterium]
MEFFVYILASHRRTLYIGVTSDIARRVTEHRAADESTFTGKYRAHRLVYVELTDSLIVAIEREKQLKRWRRDKKLRLIEVLNPD